ncbi:MAG: tetratricopeptide repeat protein [Acidobacteria bacterium]|nr:tetratricopeptide repeat protein [Acidobacteriota bacterium]
MSLSVCKNESNTLKYFSGELLGDELIRAETHIAECSICCESIAQLAKAISSEISQEEKAFLSSTLEESTKNARELVRKTLDKELETNNNVVLLTSHKPTRENSKGFVLSTWKASQLALAASLAIVFLVGVVAIYRLRTSPVDNLVAESLATIQEINLKGRPTKLRFAELEFSPENTTRGSESEDLNTKLKALQNMLEPLVANDPTPKNCQTLAQILFLEGEYAKAIEQLEKAIQIDKTNPAIFSDLALSYAAQDNYTLALESANKALVIKPDYLPAIFNRAKIYKELGQNNEASLDIELYLNLDPNSPWASELKKELESLNSTK